MKHPKILPKLNTTIDSDEDNQHHNKRSSNNYLKKSHEDFVQIINYLNTQDSDKISTSTVYRKTNNNFSKMMSLRKSFVNPATIIDEVKQKYDFYMRMKVLSKKEDDNFSNRTIRNPKPQIKLKFGDLKEMEKFQSNLSASGAYLNGAGLLSNRKLNTNNLTQTNKESFDKNTSRMKNNLQHHLRLAEMSTLLSNNKYATDNVLLQNSIEALANYFPDQYEKNQQYFKYNSTIVNSENKQIQMFIIVLDVISGLLEEINRDLEFDSINYDEINMKCISIIDALFVDFCQHLTINSSYRAEFLKNIWQQKKNFTENLMNMAKTINEQNGNKISSLLHDNQTLSQIIENESNEKDNLKTNIRVLNRENEKWLELVIEKDAKEKELKTKIEELQKQIDQKNQEFAELLLKFNSKINPFLKRIINNGNKQNVAKEIDSNKFDAEPSRNRTSSDNVINAGENKIVNLNSENQTEEILNKRRVTIVNKKVQEDNEGQDNKIKNNIPKKVELENAGLNPTLTNTNSTHTNNTNISSTNHHLKIDMKDLVNSRQKRNSIFSKTLKHKVSGGDMTVFEHRKFNIMENNVLRIDKDIKEEIINALLNHKNQFELYMNKGIPFKNQQIRDMEVQTDIQGTHIDTMMTSFTIKEMIQQSKQILEHVDSLKTFFTQFSNEKKDEEEKVQLTILEIEETKFLLASIEENYDKFTTSFYKIADECDILLKDNDHLRDQVAKYLDVTDNMYETYSEIFHIFLQCLSEDSNDIIKYCSDNKNPSSMSDEVRDLLTRILRRNSDTIEREKISPIYQFIPKPDVKNTIAYSKPPSSFNVKGKKTNSSGSLISIQAQLYNTTNRTNNYNNYKDIYDEFYASKGKIKVNMSQKKVIKIINIVYFEMIEKIYFKKEKTSFDTDDEFIQFPEILYIYFTQNFGIESLAKKKFLEFLQAITNYDSSLKRISIFSKLIFLNKNFIQSSDNSSNNFDNFVSRQLILLIQMFKVNSIIVKNPDENNTNIFLVAHKINEIILLKFSKFAITPQVKAKILAFIEKNKKNLSKNMKNFIVVDFDDLIEYMIEIFLEVKNYHSKTMRSIFRAIDIEDKEQITFFEFLLVNEYIFDKKYNYDQLEFLFRKYSDNKESLLFQHFEAISIEGDLFEYKLLSDYLKIKNENQIIMIFKNLQEELKGSALTVLDDMLKRLSVINSHSDYTNLIHRVTSLKQKIIKIDVNDYETASNLWISLKLLDSMTLDIYNEFQLSKIFNKLEFLYKSLEVTSGEKRQGNVVIKYLRNER